MSEAIKILIVEDDLIIARSIKLILEKNGYTVTGIATSGEEAIKAAGTDMPDIVLMDITLRGIDGISAAKVIQEQNDLQIIFVTQLSDAAIFRIALEARPANYITKPFTHEELLRAVALAAGRKSSIDKGADETSKRGDSIFIDVKGSFKRVLLSDILYIEANGPYTKISTIANGCLTIAMSSNHVLKILDSPLIMRVHRSYYVNIERIEDLQTHKIIIQKKEIPVSPTYKEELFGKLRFLKNTRKQ